MSSDRRAKWSAAAGLVNLLLPLRCAGCGLAGFALCAGCGGRFARLRRVHPPELSSAPPVHALARYCGRARTALLACKEGGRRDLEGPLAARVAVALREILDEHAALVGTGPVRLVPAPSRPAAVRRRGRAYLVRLARRAERGVPGVRTADCLRLSPLVRDSVGLDSARRFENLRGGVLLRRSRVPSPGTPVLLFDDVLTTGATLLNCREALAGAGLPVAGMLVLANAARET
ncbi:ComF family protein [Actinopolyspora xinjiangensis]|uniref:ComF family protein n=1 Tax=Actinopolyspora xinjiangensis TaxID=405564 RepID=UPI000B89999C|nr:ComF family protein [Actinopolyspora xinjiangensis]